MVTPAPFGGASCAHAGKAANTAASSKTTCEQFFVDGIFHVDFLFAFQDGAKHTSNRRVNTQFACPIRVYGLQQMH